MVSVQRIAFTLGECVFHDFHHKLLFSSGEVFSEQASRYHTSAASLEAKNILEVPFKDLSSMCSVYFYVNVYFMILTKIAVFVGRDLLGRGESIYPTSVVSLKAQNIIEVPFKGLSSMCCVYFM